MTKEEFVYLFGQAEFNACSLEANKVQRAAYPNTATQGDAKEEWFKYREFNVDLLLAVLIKRNILYGMNLSKNETPNKV